PEFSNARRSSASCWSK
ncbi:hypothetical protein D030_1402B, partial [Vibrio parahaemolyticus AQ3810]